MRTGYLWTVKAWYALEDFSKRKIAFDSTGPEAGSFRRIK